MLDVKLTLTGTRALIQHNVRLADPLDGYAKKMKELSGIRKKTDDVHEELGKLEYLGGLYWAQEIGPYVPGEWVFASLVRGARISRDGQKIERGILLGDEADMNALRYDGPRDPETLVSDANFRLVKAVRVGQARVMRTRPRFPRGWTVEVPLFMDPDVLNIEELQMIAGRAGRYCGIGDHRPMFGRYTATVEKV